MTVRPLSQILKSLINFFLIEADDHRVPDLGDWSCHDTKAFQIVNRRRVLGHITLTELYALLRKILLRPLAKQSAGLRKDDYEGTHFFRVLPSLMMHCCPPGLQTHTAQIPRGAVLETSVRSFDQTCCDIAGASHPPGIRRRLPRNRQRLFLCQTNLRSSVTGIVIALMASFLLRTLSTRFLARYSLVLTLVSEIPSIRAISQMAICLQ